MKKKLNLKKKSSFALVYRPDSLVAINLAVTLAKWLKERGHQVYTAPEQKKIKHTLSMKTKSQIYKCQMVVVLGGDGTYLRAVRLLNGHPVPILGVNLGSLGFLTTTRTEDLFTSLELALTNQMELYPRSIIKVKVKYHNKESQEFLALNDVVMERGPFSQLINMGIFSEKHLVSEIKADGLIVSSPTGSTAYNLSAGGPILHPQVKALVVTPIAPHSLTNRPFIFPDDLEVGFRLVAKLHSRPQRAHLVADGQKIAEIGPDDEVIISRNNKDHLMVCAPRSNYFKLLREKLKFGDRS